MNKFKFVTNFDIDTENLNDVISFYQLCTFPDPFKKMYNLRRFYINNKNEFIKIKNYLLNKSQLKQFFKCKKNNEYKLYSSFDFKSIDYPTLSDILLLKSDILSNKQNYYGYASF